MVDRKDVRRVGMLKDGDTRNRDGEVLGLDREEMDRERMQLEWLLLCGTGQFSIRGE